MQQAIEKIPAGYLQDSVGRLVPESMIKPIDLARHEVVGEIVEKAMYLQQQMREFKSSCTDDLEAFVDLSAEQYDTTLGGIKGNVSLTSFDGKYRVQRSVADYISFDERLQVAKELIDKCIHRWAKGSRSEIQVLIQDAFQTDKAGKINTARVLGLKRLDIQDEEWQQAMTAITDSVQITGSKTYINLYKRLGNSDQWQRIPLDIAAL